MSHSLEHVLQAPYGWQHPRLPRLMYVIPSSGSSQQQLACWEENLQIAAMLSMVWWICGASGMGRGRRPEQGRRGPKQQGLDSTSRRLPPANAPRHVTALGREKSG